MQLQLTMKGEVMNIKMTLKTAAIVTAGLSLIASTSTQALWEQERDETEIITQFHGDPQSAQLRLFMAGNQFVVMDNLIAEFKKQYPKYQEIYYVTIPPGKELQWILQGGAEWRAADFPNVQELIKPDEDDPDTWVMQETSAPGTGFKMLNMPDVYTTVARGHMNQLGAAGLASEFFTYTHNQLAVMADDSQVSLLEDIANDDTIIADAVDDGKPGFTPDGELTAEGLYRLFASDQVYISEPDIQTQGIERHIWRMYTNTSHAVFGCPSSGHPVCAVAVNDVRPPAPDDFATMNAFFSAESDSSLRKIVYHLKRFNLPPYAAPAATTFITSVHHLETPANIEEGLTVPRLTVGPVWGTEVEFQQFRRNNPDIVAIRVDDAAGPDGKALNRSDDVNYLATKIDTANEKNNRAARDFLEFLTSPEAQVILERAGFIPATETELNTVIPLP
jgi:hypothetical protein